MNSDFAAARHNLEKAYLQLAGSDEISQKARETVDLLLEAIIVAEHSRPLDKGVVLRFFNPVQRR